MISLFTNNFGVLNAQNFKRFITGVFGNAYVTIGKQVKWPNDDTSVATPTDTANTFYDYWNNLVGIKKITSSDISLVIPRIDWTTGTVYTEYNQDTELFAKTDPESVVFDNKFYVRNNRDQVFKCLFNNNSSQSTVMPEINIGGQLPENPYIQLSDGYRWKYMYTIPAGLKEKFFTNQFMPIATEAMVTNSAVNGRLDIIKIIDNGAGYNANANSNSYNILTVLGDGANSNITVRVATNAENGANITGVNIINGGDSYTRATISLNDPLKIQGTANANLLPVIGPPGGHGSDVAKELGASSIMISVGIDGDEGGTLPIESDESSGVRQIGILNNPLLANSAHATGLVYRATTKYNLTLPSGIFQEQETVYIGGSIATATFTAVVDHYDPLINEIYVNNIKGSFTTASTPTLRGDSSGAQAQIILASDPEIKRYSGDLLYLDNSEKITRSLTETQQLKLTLRF